MAVKKQARATRDGDVALTWVKHAHQERSRDTHRRILDAAERLLARGRAWSEISVVELVAEASTSIGSFYARFRDKDTLLHVLHVELIAQGVATAKKAQELAQPGVPLDALVRAFVGVAVSSYRDQRGLRRALLVEMCTQPVFRERATELTKLTCAGLVDVMAMYTRSKDRKRIAEVVDLCHRMVYGTLDQDLLYEGSPTGRKTSAKLVDELATAMLAYLGTQLPLR